MARTAKAKKKTSAKGAGKKAPQAKKKTGAKKKTAAKKKTGGRRKAAGKKKTAGRKKAARAGQAPRLKASNLSPDDKRFIIRNMDKLSSAVLRAKWIHNPEEHEDQPGQTLATRQRGVIEQWAAEREAAPATVRNGARKYGGRPGVLRFDFPNYGGKGLEKVEWEDWFKTFESRKLVFVYQEHKKDGKESNFFRLESPLRQEA